MTATFNPRKRYVLEGEWSGYRSDQQRVCHRRVYKGNRKKLLTWAAQTYSICYTDGTCLYLRVRECELREKVKEIHGYDELIDDCFYNGVTSVQQLCDIRAAKESARAKSAVAA